MGEERKYIRSGFKAVDNYMVSNGVEGFVTHMEPI